MHPFFFRIGPCAAAKGARGRGSAGQDRSAAHVPHTDEKLRGRPVILCNTWWDPIIFGVKSSARRTGG